MKTNKGYAPIRTCISCGAKNSKSEMIRLVLNPDGVAIRDVDGTGQGRGALTAPVGRACQQATDSVGSLEKTAP